MPEFNTREDVKHWLKTRKREEIILLATRAALRKLPVFAVDERENMPTHLFAVFRAASVSWFAGTWPDIQRSEIVKAAADAQYDSGQIAIVETADDIVSRATANAVKSIGSNTLTEVIEFISRRYASAFDASTTSVFHRGEVCDVDALDNGATVLKLSAMPLWPRGMVPREFTMAWEAMKSRLPEGEYWDVWTTWYDHRLRGIPPDMELEKARILTPKNNDWEQGPARVNAIIYQLIVGHGKPGQMPEFKGREGLQTWLNARKPEEVALVAARTALRALPTLKVYKRDDLLQVLSVFRAVSQSWLAGTWPNLGEEVAHTATAHAMTDAILRTSPGADISHTHIIDTINGTADLAGTNVDAAASAAAVAALNAFKAATCSAPESIAACIASIANTPYVATFSTAGSNAVGNAGRSFHTRVGNKSVSVILTRNSTAETADDRAIIERGTTVAELSAMPLWPDGKTPKGITRLWDRLKSEMPESEGWDVWTTWYEDRLRGAPADMEFEKARALIPDEDWKKGPAHVNAIIKRLIAEYQPSFKKTAAQMIAQQPKAVAASAEEERARIAQRIEELRANLPNEPEYLEIAQREIAELEAMRSSLTIISQEARNLREGATEEQAESAAAAVEDLARQLKTWVTEYLTKERADAATDALIVGGLVSFLLWCGMPAWLAAPYMIARFNGIEVIEKIKAMLQRYPTGPKAGVTLKVKEFVRRNLAEHRDTFRELAKR